MPLLETVMSPPFPLGEHTGEPFTLLPSASVDAIRGMEGGRERFDFIFCLSDCTKTRRARHQRWKQKAKELNAYEILSIIIQIDRVLQIDKTKVKPSNVVYRSCVRQIDPQPQNSKCIIMRESGSLHGLPKYTGVRLW